MLTFLEPGKTYHVYTHANGFENLFRCDRNYLYFLDKYKKYIHPITDTYAYCLMPNHFHLMIRIKSKEEVFDFLKAKHSHLQAFDSPGDFSLAVSREFSHMFNGYTQGYNKMYNRKGGLFIHKFKRKEVDSLDYKKQLLFYIHNNPVKDGFVNRMADWEYSSYNSYISGEETLINTEYMLNTLGSLKAFEEFHQRKTITQTFIKSIEDFL